MSIVQTIMDRRSIRAFTDKPVEKEKIEKIMNAAVHAPNAMGAQNWYFAVVTDPGLLEELRADLRNAIINGPAPPHVKEIAINNPQFNPTHGGKALVICAGVAASPFSAFDVSMAAQNICLAAKELGLGACPIGSVKDMGAEMKSKFVPEQYTAFFGISIGYPAPVDGSNYKERDMSKVVYFE
jgi:nitroreductase